MTTMIHNVHDWNKQRANVCTVQLEACTFNLTHSKHGATCTLYLTWNKFVDDSYVTVGAKPISIFFMLSTWCIFL